MEKVKYYKLINKKDYRTAGGFYIEGKIYSEFDTRIGSKLNIGKLVIQDPGRWMEVSNPNEQQSYEIF